MRSLTSWRAEMGQKQWALEFQLLYEITHFLESRNGTETMNLGITAITWYYSHPGEQEWDRNHESWNASYHMTSLTSWRAGIRQKPWALESQLSHDITHSLESKKWDRNHEPWNPSYHMRSLTSWRAGMWQKPWILEFQLSHDITHILESSNRTETLSLGIPIITWDHFTF